MKLSRQMMQAFIQISRGKSKREDLAKALHKSVNRVSEILKDLEREGFIIRKKESIKERSRIFAEIANTAHAQKLKELIFQYPTINFEEVLSESKLIFLAAISDDWITREEACKLSKISKYMSERYSAMLKNRGIIIRKKSLYTINEKAWPLLKEFLSAYKKYPTLKGAMRWKFQDESLIEVDSTDLIKGSITGFAEYEKYGIKVFVVKILYKIPEKKLTKEEIFVHSLFQIEDTRTLHLALLFYLKNKLNYEKTLSLAMRYGKYSVFTSMIEILRIKQERVKFENLPEFDRKDFNRLAYMYKVKNV